MFLPPKKKYIHVASSAEAQEEKVSQTCRITTKTYTGCVSEWAFLAPKYDAMDVINNRLLQMIPADAKSYQSIDSILDSEQAVLYTVEFQNLL